ncbi:hypothetical protein KSB_54590 [Ktedonobacter robiniae]|uniref:Uncharacterized protein n=1 Tax=Ktedonobacter robiniae TaxID=2778365 RepID=A0ABQ3UVZ7_9CHLR|nr:hypothetical protein KSB_54590 [Ktedonobacter robiniae]
MDGVRQEAHATANEDDNELEESGHPQAQQRDFQCPEATVAGFKSGIDIDLAMAMSMEEGNCVDKPAQRTMAMSMVMMVVIMVRTCMIVLMIMLMTMIVMVMLM